MWRFFHVGRGSTGVGERVEKGHAGGEWLSYSEQCLVRRFALRSVVLELKEATRGKEAGSESNSEARHRSEMVVEV
ncbi:hypothetical protein KM043_005984 [Ampulex compressa]|nr:hypothetical protein KM043_005984 [Ampulex compressa]